MTQMKNQSIRKFKNKFQGLTSLLLGSVSALLVIGMGIALPSCPGQQAMQTQIDVAMRTATDLNKKLIEKDNQLKAMQAGIDAMSAKVTELTAKRDEDSKKFEELRNAIASLQNHMTSVAASSSAHKSKPSSSGGKPNKSGKRGR